MGVRWGDFCLVPLSIRTAAAIPGISSFGDCNGKWFFIPRRAFATFGDSR